MACKVGYRTDGRTWSAGQVGVNASGYAWPDEWYDVTIAAMDRWNSVAANFQFIDDPASTCGLCAHFRDRDNGVRATTRTTPAQPNAALQHFEIEINTFYAFQPTHPEEPGQGTPCDLETLIAHELGHTLFLDNLKGQADQHELMYFDVPAGAAKPLGPGDRHGILSLYP